MSFQATPIVQALPANVQNLRRAAPNDHQMQEVHPAVKRARMENPIEQQAEMNVWTHPQHQHLNQAGPSTSNHHQEGPSSNGVPVSMPMNHEDQLHPGCFQGPLVPTEMLVPNQETDQEEPEGCHRPLCKKLEKSLEKVNQRKNEYKRKYKETEKALESCTEKKTGYKSQCRDLAAENERLKKYERQCTDMAVEMKKLKEELASLKKNGIAVLSPLTPADSPEEQQPSTSSSVPVMAIKEEPKDYEESEPPPPVNETAQWIEFLLQDNDIEIAQNPDIPDEVPVDGFLNRGVAVGFLANKTSDSYHYENREGWKNYVFNKDNYMIVPQDVPRLRRVDFFYKSFNKNGPSWKSLSNTDKQSWKDSIKKLASIMDEQVKVGLIRILNVDSVVPTLPPQLFPVQQ
ncbi:hypothetical protein B9Z55_007274 [Caenorhabditis nigoni]|uniref:Uncharacterized protein n=1 Tax=Caenorhabditis nigoni TaxID=1611254 RepID=A0A2G5V9J9_9PELO|nr:hypothetical protein B9Z55_007274 [Caenorhabditis nigoni]